MAERFPSENSDELVIVTDDPRLRRLSTEAIDGGSSNSASSLTISPRKNNPMTDIMNELRELNQGMNHLTAGMNDLNGGMAKLTDGMTELTKGMTTLTDSTKVLTEEIGHTKKEMVLMNGEFIYMKKNITRSFIILFTLSCTIYWMKKS